MKNSFNTPLTASTTNTWITPREILSELGHFDLDPCAATNQPWPCADKSYTAAENGLIQPWQGRVFCNPPYGAAAAPFMERMKAHKKGLAVVFARTDTRWFHETILLSACALFFWRGRIRFCREDGTQGASPNAASVLVAWAEDEIHLLKSLEAKGLGKLAILKTQH